MEHPQALIDTLQYHCPSRGDFLPPASYSLVQQVNGRGAFSFCMCPGGIIAPAATNEGEVVVNGWSPSKRNNPYANSGIVVSVEEKDMANARVQMEKAAVELRAYKGFIDGLEQDGLISKKEEYKIEWKKGELSINGKKQPASVVEKYSSFLKDRKDFTINKSDDDFNIHKD